MKLRPLQDRVIVKQSEAETKTASGILLPDAAKEKPTRARSSPSAPASSTTTASPWRSASAPATTIYYGKYSGTDVEVNGEKFVILRETDILGVLE